MVNNTERESYFVIEVVEAISLFLNLINKILE